MDLHRQRVKVGFERGFVVGQGQQFKWHNFSFVKVQQLKLLDANCANSGQNASADNKSQSGEICSALNPACSK
jgi:hypothetical protein